MVPTRTGGRAIELPLLGYVAAGLPIEAVASNETIAVPEDLVGKRDTYVLRVRGDASRVAGSEPGMQTGRLHRLGEQFDPGRSQPENGRCVEYDEA